MDEFRSAGSEDGGPVGNDDRRPERLAVPLHHNGWRRKSITIESGNIDREINGKNIRKARSIGVDSFWYKEYDERGISIDTVKTHLHNIMKKTGFDNRLDLIMNAKDTKNIRRREGNK